MDNAKVSHTAQASFVLINTACLNIKNTQILSWDPAVKQKGPMLCWYNSNDFSGDTSREFVPKSKQKILLRMLWPYPAVTGPQKFHELSWALKMYRLLLPLLREKYLATKECWGLGILWAPLFMDSPFAIYSNPALWTWYWRNRWTHSTLTSFHRLILPWLTECQSDGKKMWRSHSLKILEPQWVTTPFWRSLLRSRDYLV